MILLVVVRVYAVSALLATMRSRPVIRSVLCGCAIHMRIAVLRLRRHMLHVRIPARDAFWAVSTRILPRPVFASIVYMRVVGPA
jgi:hypothetical protein